MRLENQQRGSQPQCLILRNGNVATLDEMLGTLSLYWEPVQKIVQPDGNVYMLLWPRDSAAANRSELSSVQARFLLAVLRKSFIEVFGH